ncbi:MAG: S-layer homology domain-containing protein [Clostridia bacterium]|nr:S-layer homology domain-containing protein [Clostridia bacterium]
MKKLLSLFLCICMCLTAFSALSFTAAAGPGYKIYVNGEAVSDSINVNGGTASVSYDSSTETLTLTLDNCMIGKTYSDGLNAYSVYVSTDAPHFKLELIGYNECASSLRIEDMYNYDNGTTLITSGPAKDGELTVCGRFSIEKGDLSVDACKLRLTGEQTNGSYAAYIRGNFTIGKPALKGGSTYDTPSFEVSTDRNIGLFIFGHLLINNGYNTFSGKNYGLVCSNWGDDSIFSVTGGHTDCSGSRAAVLILALKEGCTNLIDFAAGYGETSGNVLSKSAPFYDSIGYENAVYFSWLPNGSSEQLTVSSKPEENILDGTFTTNAAKSCSFGSMPSVFVTYDAGDYGQINGEQTVYQTYTSGQKIGVLPVPVNTTFKTGAFNNMYFEGWYVGDTYEGTLIDENYVLTSGIQLHALWMEGNGKSFKDVKDSSWYKEAANYCSIKGLISGTGDGSTFSPDMVCSRAMVVSILYRLSGEPYVWEGDNQFSDVKNSAWYAKGVIWAANNGIVSGIGGGKFAPDASITREQLASIMMRYASFRGLRDPDSHMMLIGFPDSDKISSWAGEGMSWAAGSGLISGKPNAADGRNYLDPQGTATRAEFASILLRYLKSTDGALTFYVNNLFRVSVPYLWQGNVVCETFSGTTGDGISFYCKQENELSGAGRICGLVFDPDHEYLNLPHFEYFCAMMDSGNIAYNAVFDLPTDVQCNEDPTSPLAAEYFSMFEMHKAIQVESDWYTLSFGVG